MYVGEDTALAEAAAAPARRTSAAREVVTQHAIDEAIAARAWSGAPGAGSGLPLLIRRHPRLRDEFPLWIFWKRTHVWLPLRRRRVRPDAPQPRCARC